MRRLDAVAMPFCWGSTKTNLGVTLAPKAIRKLWEEELLGGVKYLPWDGEQADITWHNLRDHSAVIPKHQTKEALVQELKDLIGRLVMPFFIGGDHGNTYFILRAYSEAFGKENLSLVYFDAHPDAKPSSDYLHAKWVVKLVEEGLLDPRRILLIGARNVEQEEQTFLKQNGVKCFPQKFFLRGRADSLDSYSRKKQLERYLQKWGGVTYVSIDIDVLNPSEAPATANKAGGGLALRELLEFLWVVKCSSRVVGLDLMEVNPEQEMDWEITPATALTLLRELAGYFGKEV